MRIIHGDSLDVLKTLEADSIDSVVTDPPYGLKFMNKHWDYELPTPEFWREVLRVMKPGAHLLSFGGTRTYHRMAVFIEDAGFEIRDQIQWLYGSGFPKSLDVSKAIDKAAGVEREVVGVKSDPRYLSPRTNSPNHMDRERGTKGGHGVDSKAAQLTAPATQEAKQWQGWGSALKPAHEPIVVARKPFAGPLYKNVLTHGTGGLNIDASRIGSEVRTNGGMTSLGVMHDDDWLPQKVFSTVNGRFPANVILSCSCETEADQMKLVHDENCPVALLDAQSGVSKSAGGRTVKRCGYEVGKVSAPSKWTNEDPGFGDTGGASRFFYVAKTSRAERNAGLEGMPESMPSNAVDRASQREGNESAPGRGSLSKPRANHHPTVKPIKLMEYLIRLVTPPGGTVLDPFMGSGSTGVAAKRLGFDFVGIEREADYVAIAQKRIDHV